ncbi:MAG: O-antigen ligase family protein [Bacteroidota bacterium]
MLPAIWHRYIFLFGIIGLAAGMLFGTVPTSIPQIILAANWLIERNFDNKWRQVKTNKIFWVLISLYVLHLIGMSYTQNTQQGLSDLRNKMPLLILPLILFTSTPLSRKEFRLLFGFFFLSVTVSSICCYLVYAGFTKKNIIDVRNASIFMSHIRFSLFIAFAIIGMIYGSLKEKSTLIRFICLISSLWLLFFMYKLEMATGFLCLTIVSTTLIVFFSLKKTSKPFSIAVLSGLAVMLGLFFYFAFSQLNIFEKSNHNSSNILLEKTKNGRYFFHDTVSTIAENGNLIFININEDEMKTEWRKRSEMNYNEEDKKGNELKFTILRYLASRGFTKDSTGIASLSEKDIVNIENGNPNYKYNINSGLISKWRSLVWEYNKYKRGENPSGQTLTMRMAFWKNGSYIVHENPIVGVGTGDIQSAYDKMYVQTHSKLDKEWRLRCHNQYLAITVAFGILGLIIFLIYLFYPAIVLRKEIHLLYWPFFLISLLSFITEDTLETQSGVTFFIFFQTLFLWLASFQYKIDFENERGSKYYK